MSISLVLSTFDKPTCTFVTLCGFDVSCTWVARSASIVSILSIVVSSKLSITRVSFTFVQVITSIVYKDDITGNTYAVNPGHITILRYDDTISEIQYSYDGNNDLIITLPKTKIPKQEIQKQLEEVTVYYDEVNLKYDYEIELEPGARDIKVFASGILLRNSDEDNERDYEISNDFIPIVTFKTLLEGVYDLTIIYNK